MSKRLSKRLSKRRGKRVSKRVSKKCKQDRAFAPLLTLVVGFADLQNMGVADCGILWRHGVRVRVGGLRLCSHVARPAFHRANRPPSQLSSQPARRPPSQPGVHRARHPAIQASSHPSNHLHALPHQATVDARKPRADLPIPSAERDGAGQSLGLYHVNLTVSTVSTSI